MQGSGFSRLFRAIPYTLYPILFLPSLALAAPMTFQELAFELVDILDLATVTLLVLAIVAYFWGLAINVRTMGEEDKNEKKKAYLFWGLIILFVMFSVWGILQLLKNTVFGNQVFDSTTGQQSAVFCDAFGDCGGEE